MTHLHRSLLHLLLAVALAWTLGGCGKRDASMAGDAGVAQAAGESETSPATTEKGLTLSAESRAMAELTVEPVRFEEVHDNMHTTGEIQVNGRHVARIVSRLPGWVDEVRKIQGDPVRRGDIVLTIHSPEYQTAGGELLNAWNRLEQARTKGDSLEVGTARAIYASARKRLQFYGEGDAEIDGLLRDGEPTPILHVHSPIDGSIIENAMVPGHRVEAGTEICFVSDLRTVWAILNVFEKDLAAVKIGSGVSIAVGAYPGTVFAGKVAFVDNLMDESTRTVKVRVEVDNREGRLKPGMFVDGDIDRDESRTALAVPTEAVQQEGAERFVFVFRMGRFLRQEVELGVVTDTLIEIRSGLSQGDSVVVQGAFIVKSELLKSGFGDAD